MVCEWLETLQLAQLGGLSKTSSMWSESRLNSPHTLRQEC